APDSCPAPTRRSGCDGSSRAASPRSSNLLQRGLAFPFALRRSAPAVALEDEPQPLERQEFFDIFDGFGQLRDQPGLPAGADHARILAALLLDARDQAVDQGGIAIDQPRLN